MKFLKVFILFFPFFALAKNLPPQISIFFTKNFYSKDEIEVFLSFSNLKNVSYDLKVAVEKEKEILSEIYNEKEKKWQTSLYYLKNLFSGPSFEGKVKLRLKREYLNFEGEGEIVVRIRESGGKKFTEKREKINILKKNLSENYPREEFLAYFSPLAKENFSFSPFFFAFFISFFSTTLFYFFKKFIQVKK